MVNAELYGSLFAALSKRSAMEIAKVSHGFLKMPVVATDAAFVVIAKWPNEPLGDEQWDANRVNFQIEPRFLETFREDDHFARHMEAKAPILTDWGHYAGRARLTALIRTKDSVAGFVSALTTGCEVEPWHYAAIEAIAETYSFLAEMEVGARSKRLDFSTAFLYGMLGGTLCEGEERASMRAQFTSQLPGPYLLISAKMRNPYEKALERYLGSELEQYFGSVAQAVCDGTLYLLTGSVPADYRNSEAYHAAASAMKKLGAVCGCSRPFSCIDDLADHRWQADSALRIGEALKPDKTVYHYDDFLLDIVLDEVTSRVGLGLVVPTVVRALRREDAENGTEYLETLRHYILSGRNKKATAAALNIHRNTLLYRLEHIELAVGGDGAQEELFLYFLLERHAAGIEAGKSARAHAPWGNGEGTGGHRA
ncbi:MULTISPECIES: CdaR family transcriptional regulator [unclassified Adlercreutzia]|uniref:PucR family transcriptional regulator n=1 Tax=unclassified Adlercreutzia TaxID=2636013 RepID=UPI0013EBF10D|nr:MULTISPECIES: helix-turn-helix domain-containing protein [unclassified Adlercreutzia]